MGRHAALHRQVTRRVHGLEADMSIPEWASGWAADGSEHCGQPAVTVECPNCRGSHVHVVCAVTGYDVPRCPGR